MRSRTGFVVMAVLLGLFAWVMYQRFELVSETVDLGPGPLARSDPYLAARRYLEQSGVTDVRRSENLRDAASLPAGATLIVTDLDEVVLDDRQATRLLDWVAAGGHLILAAADEDDYPNPLLAPFGLMRRFASQMAKSGGERSADPDEQAGAEAAPAEAEPASQEETPPAEETAEEEAFDEETAEDEATDEEVADDEAAEEADEPDTRTAPEHEITQLQVDDAGALARVHFFPRWILEPVDEEEETDEPLPADSAAAADAATTSSASPLRSAGSAAGLHFAQFAWGRGRVSLASDLAIWNNRRIGREDHAYFLGGLVKADAPVLFLTGARMPGLDELLRRYASEALFATALCLLAWIVRRARRFGPLRENETPARRALGEHILAGARYQWRHHGAGAVLAGARGAVLERAARHLPALARAGRDELRAALAAHTGLSPAAIDQALHADPGRNPDALRQTAAELQTLWKKL